LLEEAFELSVHGEEKHWGIEYMERVARHESGHAFMYWRAGNTPAYLTIVARGGHGGYMEHSDDDSSAPLKTRVELIDNIRTSLGGRAAEIVYYGEEGGISSGASGDLQNATRIARAMICNYGMDDAIGLAVLSPEEASRGPMAAKISERISEIIKREMYATVKIITESQSQLDKLVTALLDKNRLTSEEINNILGKPDKPPVT
jgi:ATP-dependent Zn protease